MGAARGRTPSAFAVLRPNRVYTAEELTDRAGPFDPRISARVTIG